MRNGKLFKMAKINERTKNISQNIFNVSLDGENKQQDFFTELSSEAVTPSTKNTANNVCLNPGIRLNKYDAKKCKNRVDVGSKSKKIELSSAATKPKMKDIADYVCCNSEIQLQRYCIKEYNSHVDVAPKSTKCKYNEAIHFNTESRADKISSVNGNASLNPEIRLYKFDMKEYNNHVDDGLKSKKIKLSNEVIAENTTNQIMSFKNRDCWNPEIKL